MTFDNKALEQRNKERAEWFQKLRTAPTPLDYWQIKAKYLEWEGIVSESRLILYKMIKETIEELGRLKGLED